jgi:hypothetical protein
MATDSEIHFKEIHLFYTEELKQQFKTGKLWKEWIDKYPQLFRKEDWCENQFQLGYCFFEMLTAIQIFHSTGFLNICWGNLASKNLEEHKKAILNKRFTKDLYNLAVHGGKYLGHSPQPPDVFFYHPTDENLWFFCEVKGARDRLSPWQRAYFAEIDKLSNGRVYICRFKEFKPGK